MQNLHSASLDSPKKLSSEAYKQIDLEIEKYPTDQKKSAVIASLIIAQQERGSITPEIEKEVAAYLDMPPIAVHEIATFYNMFDVKPKAKYKIVVCTNLPCALRNSKHAMNILSDKLGIKPGESTSDGLFSLQEGECFGACADAPVMLINNHQMHSWLNEKKIDGIITDLTMSNDTKTKTIREKN